MAANENPLNQGSPLNQAAGIVLRRRAEGGHLDPILRRLLTDALVDTDRSDRPSRPGGLVSSAARAAAAWIDVDLHEREKVVRDLLELADALPPQPKEGPALPDKITLVHQTFKRCRITHAFGGALAVGFYGEPRATGDIDVNVFVSSAAWPELRRDLEPLGVEIEIDEGDLKNNELRLEWGCTPLHLFFSYDSLHEKMERHVHTVPFNSHAIPLVAPEHLVVRKAILDRPKDWHDIEQILVATDPLDVGEIEDWLERMVGRDNPRMEKLGEVKAGLSLD